MILAVLATTLSLEKAMRAEKPLEVLSAVKEKYALPERAELPADATSEGDEFSGRHRRFGGGYYGGYNLNIFVERLCKENFQYFFV